MRSREAAALALGAAACGGDDKEEFVKEANALCKKYKAKTNAVEEPGNIQNAAQAADYLGKLSPIVNEGVAELKTLEPPDDVESDWKTYVAKQQEGATIVETAANKAKAKDASGLADLQRLQATSTQAKAAAKKAGATDCASAG